MVCELYANKAVIRNGRPTSLDETQLFYIHKYLKGWL